MPTLIENASSWLGDRLQAVGGHLVTVRRLGSGDQPGITAVLIFREYEIFDEDDIMTKVTVADWTFVAADLQSGFSFRAGDLILDDKGQTFEVLAFGNRPCLEPLDSSQLLWTVHSKLSPV